MIVDDDVIMCVSLMVVLIMFGVVVVIVLLGCEVFVMVVDMWLMVVLFDFVMFDGDGFWLFDVLWCGVLNGDSGLFDVCVLVVIVYVGLVDECCVLEVGFDGYLCKLVDVCELVYKIVYVMKCDG